MHHLHLIDVINAKTFKTNSTIIVIPKADQEMVIQLSRKTFSISETAAGMTQRTLSFIAEDIFYLFIVNQVNLKLFMEFMSWESFK